MSIYLEAKEDGIANKLQAFQQFFLPALEQFFIEQKTDTYLTDHIIKEMMEKLTEFTLRGGKRVRPALLYYGYQGFTDANVKLVLPIAIACELMQSFLLIHDDIMDKAELRRGAKTVHQSFSYKDPYDLHYGESMAILVGNIAGYLGIQAIAQIPIEDEYKLRIISLYAQTCINVGYGQALDLSPHHYQNLAETNIYNIYTYKTACYTTEFPLLCAALLAKQNNKEVIAKVKALGNCMGILFQIQDDILDLFGNSKVIGKNVVNDMQEGKKTLLICKAWEKANAKQQKELEEIYGTAITTVETIKKIRDIIIDTGTLDYIEQAMQSHAEQAIALLGSLRLREVGRSFIEQLIEHWALIDTKSLACAN